MKHGFAVRIIILAAGLMLHTVAFGAELKFGRLNFAEIQTKSQKLTAAYSELQKMQAESQSKTTGLTGEVNKLEEQLSKAAAADRQKIEAALKEKQEELSNEEQELRVKLMMKQRSIQSAAALQLKEILDRIAKEEGFTAIFRTETLPYAEGLIDLTDRLAKELDAAPALEPK
jgi:Skp family chaperone for outer membrane proteins